MCVCVCVCATVCLCVCVCAHRLLVLLLQGETVRARVLVCCDGATSRLATSLGYCTEAPKGVCSRSYVKGGTHNVDFDGETANAGQKPIETKIHL